MDPVCGHDNVRNTRHVEIIFFVLFRLVSPSFVLTMAVQFSVDINKKLKSTYVVDPSLLCISLLHKVFLYIYILSISMYKIKFSFRPRMGAISQLIYNYL